MTRLINFSDGFTSASAPVVSAGTQEDFNINNNQVAPYALLAIDAAEYKSAFIDFEISRYNGSFEFRQSGSAIMSYDGTDWILNIGNYQGDDIIQDAITSLEHVVLSVATLAGVGTLSHTSGNMATVHFGKMRTIITRISAI
jgi:hypothetical protein